MPKISFDYNGSSFEIISFDVLDSTHLYARAYVSTLLNNTLILAKEQTSGIGRRNGEWISPVGNFSGTFVFKNKKTTPLFSSHLAFVIAVGLKEYFLSLQFDQFSFKWPNDIYDKECIRKVGGILIEIQNDDILVSIGLNTYDSPKINKSTYTTTSLKELKANNLIKNWSDEELFKCLDASLKTYLNEGFDSFQYSWLSSCGHLNQSVSLSDGRTGCFEGINSSGDAIIS